MANKRSESGYYWVDKAITCNGCKFLNFYKCGCRRGMPPGEVRPLSTYKNGDDYIAVLKPTDCDYQKEQKSQEEAVSDVNINSNSNTEGGMKLSEERAKTVKNYFVANGIDANRIIVVGNGNTKMVADPNGADAELNRRTDIFFKTIES